MGAVRLFSFSVLLFFIYSLFSLARAGHSAILLFPQHTQQQQEEEEEEIEIKREGGREKRGEWVVFVFGGETKRGYESDVCLFLCFSLCFVISHILSFFLFLFLSLCVCYYYG